MIVQRMRRGWSAQPRVEEINTESAGQSVEGDDADLKQSLTFSVSVFPTHKKGEKKAPTIFIYFTRDL